MYSWRVLCIAIDEESQYDDCRAIHTIGKEVANNLKEKPVDMVASQIASGNSHYHVTVGDRDLPLQSAKAEGGLYVRTMDEDSSDDPLLDLPSLEEYRADQRFSQL